MVAQLVAEEFDCDPHDVSIVYQGSQNGLPGHRARRLPHHGDAGGRRRGRDRARSRRRRCGRRRTCWRSTRTTWSGSTAASRSRACPEQRKSLAEIAIMLHLFKHSFPEDMECGLEDSQGLRPPVHDDALRRPQGPRRLLPVHGPRLPRPRGRGGHRDRRGDVPRLRRRARLRHAGEPALARGAHRRRHGAGHRDGAVRGVRLRRRRPAADLAATSTTSSRRRWRCRS